MQGTVKASVPCTAETNARGGRLLACLLFLLLSISYCTNCFSIVPDSIYKSHGADSEAVVVGRMLDTESNGFASNTGFLVHNGYVDTFAQFRTGPRPISVKDLYFGNAGLQGWVMSAVDLPLYAANVDGTTRLVIAHGLVAIALAAVLSLWIYFLAVEFGPAAALAAGLTTFYSSWLTSFADNLYWVPVTWFVPAVLTWYWAVYRPGGMARGSGLFYLLYGIALCARALCGFEYITAVAGASVAVMLFAVTRSGWSRASFRILVWFGLAIVAALTCAFIIQVLLVSVHLGSFSQAAGDFIHRVRYRSLGAEGLDPTLAASLAVPLNDLFKTYLHKATVLTIPGLASFDASEALTILLVPFALGSLATTIRARTLRPSLPLDLLVWCSVGAAISWHIVARGHSQIHTFYNFVLWSVPALVVVPAASVHAFGRAFVDGGSLRPRGVVVILGMFVAWTAYWSPVLSDQFSIWQDRDNNIGIRGQKVTLDIRDRTIAASFSCDGIDLTKPFFVRLHAVTERPAASGDTTKTVRFAFRDRATTIELNEIRYGHCAFRLPDQHEAFDRLSVGQFTDEAGATVAWQEEFSDPLKPSLPAKVRVLDLTDRNWLHGRLRSEPRLLLIWNDMQRRRALLYAKRVCAGAACANVMSVSFDQWPYIWLKLDSPLDGRTFMVE